MMAQVLSLYHPLRRPRQSSKLLASDRPSSGHCRFWRVNQQSSPSASVLQTKQNKTKSLFKEFQKHNRWGWSCDISIPYHNASLSTGCLTSNPAPCQCSWEGSNRLPRPLPTSERLQMQFQVPGFDLVQTRILRSFGKQTRRRRSPCVSLCF